MTAAAPNIIVSPERFNLVQGVNEDCTLELTNVGFEAVLYRLLTTSPMRYVVRHTKGVIRGNSSVKVTIALSRKNVLDGRTSSATKGDATVLTDHFRLEYATMGERDIIEPHASNVPQLIKEKKAQDKNSVIVKSVMCSLQLDETTAASLSGSRLGSDAHAAAAAVRGTAAGLEQTTLAEKNRRREVEAAVQQQRATSGKTSCVQETSTSRKTSMLIVIAVAVLSTLVLWWMVE